MTDKRSAEKKMTKKPRADDFVEKPDKVWSGFYISLASYPLTGYNPKPTTTICTGFTISSFN